MADPTKLTARAVRLIVTGADSAVPATPRYINLGAISATLDVGEDGEQINKLGNGVEPSKKILSGIKDISNNIEMTMNYDTIGLALHLAVGKPTITNLSSGAWTAAAVVTAGTVVTGTTPATDDLYCLVGGTTHATVAPDTTALEDKAEIVDGDVTWVVRKGTLKKATGQIVPCLESVLIEYEFIQ